VPQIDPRECQEACGHVLHYSVSLIPVTRALRG
jgi:hypothetical protein